MARELSLGLYVYHFITFVIFCVFFLLSYNSLAELVICKLMLLPIMLMMMTTSDDAIKCSALYLLRLFAIIVSAVCGKNFAEWH